MPQPERHVAIIGGGPAGLTAGYLLSKEGYAVTVFESDPKYLGGISKTVEYKGFRFDIGGHRFFSKSAEVEGFWTEILGSDLIDRPRLSRIYYRGQFFQYPLKAMEALTKLGILESTLCVLSYLKARMFPVKDPKSFQDWVSNQFGKRLFGIFFKTYTEKVWGMSCKDISADWAAQRIKGLSLGSAIRNALFPPSTSNEAGGNGGDRSKVIKSLIDTFRYPRLGPGMMWERCGEKIREMGGTIHMGSRVKQLQKDADGNWTVTAEDLATRDAVQVRANHVISSTDIRALGRMIQPAVSSAASKSANALRYRDFLTVSLMVRDTQNIPDNWIYIHDPKVKVGRIQNFKSWSPELVPDASMACYGLEYFCFEGDGLWSMDDKDLIALAAQEIEHVGLAKQSEVTDGHVIRQAKAYPVYDDEYTQHVDEIRKELDEKYSGLHLVGRNGMHKYNNQDHAMMTAMLTVRNILAGRDVYDVWQVNQDAEYHEAGDVPESSASGASGLRMVPTRVRTAEELANLSRNLSVDRGPVPAVSTGIRPSRPAPAGSSEPPPTSAA
jgi:protoporphyrinogen oxidase